MKSIRALLAVGLIGLLASHVTAQVPNLLNYQGRLSDPSGNPQNGTFTMQFAVYDALTGGNQLPAGSPWSETQSVTVTNGVFNVLLGGVTALPANLFAGGPTDSAGPLRFLQVTVNGEALSPRQRIASAAYSINSGATNVSANASPLGYIYGGVVTNSVSNPSIGLDISAYHVRDNTDAYDIAMTSAMTKLVNATWVAGGNSGGLDTGIVGASPCWVYVYAIGQSTNPVSADVLFTKTLSSPTMPSGWDTKRLLGARRWNGTAFRTFTTQGNGTVRTVFYTDTLTALVNNQAASSWTDVNASTEIPAGLSHIAHLSAKIVGNDNGTYSTLYTREKGSSQAADFSTCRVSIDIGYTLSRSAGGSFIQDTDANGYFQYQYYNGGGAYIYCRGFEEVL